MRETRNAQYSIFDNYSAYPIGQRLSRLSDLLDGYPGLLEIQAGVEGNISEFKHSFGASKAIWKGLEGLNAFVWASTLCYNLIRTVRISTA